MSSQSIPVIIIPVLCHYEKLAVMLESIDYPVEHVIIVDNGGKLNNQKKSKYIDRLSIINMPANLGVPTSWNLGIQLEPMRDYWLFSQDDIVWQPGGLDQIANTASMDNVCLGVDLDRPFSTFSVGANVFMSIDIFDESYFPLLGDDFSFYRRCLNSNIEIADISNCYIAEKSASIKTMLLNGSFHPSVFMDNMSRSMSCRTDYVEGWKLDRRRQQGIMNLDPQNLDNLIATLDAEFDLEKFFGKAPWKKSQHS